jgi:HAMP domain-containing protein
MGFWLFVEKLQKKPEATRYKLAVAATILIAAFVVFAWLIYLYTTSSLKEQKVDIVDQEKNSSPVSIVKDTIGDIYESFKRLQQSQ